MYIYKLLSSSIIDKFWGIFIPIYVCAFTYLKLWPFFSNQLQKKTKKFSTKVNLKSEFALIRRLRWFFSVFGAGTCQRFFIIK